MRIKLLFIVFIAASSMKVFGQKLPVKLVNTPQEGPIINSSLRVSFDYDKTKDPLTGDIPKDRLKNAKDKAKTVKQNKKASNSFLANRTTSFFDKSTFLNWTERGPYADAVGTSNGNTRANSAVTAGRVRAMWPDISDITGKTVWAAGVDGGLWKTTDITTSPANWVAVNDDQFNNLAISSIAQNPLNKDVLYAATGESFMGFAGGSPTANAVKGVGVYKSIDKGLTWTLLSSTTGGSI